MWVRSLDQEDPLEEDTATHSSILAGRIPWTEEPRGLQFIGSHRVRHDCSDLARTCTHPKSSLAGPWVAEHPEFNFLPSPIPHTIVVQACAHAHTHTHRCAHRYRDKWTRVHRDTPSTPKDTHIDTYHTLTCKDRHTQTETHPLLCPNLEGGVSQIGEY